MLSIIVPCYNEEQVLQELWDELRPVLDDLEQDALDSEVLFVDDGSIDDTKKILIGLSEDKRVKYISLSRNYGKESAMYAGFCNATGDLVAVMDADLQDPPEMLLEMVQLMKSGEYDNVAAKRIDRKGEPFNH